MLQIVGVASLKCKDVEDLTVSLKHMLPTMLNFWLNKFICLVAKQNGEHYTPSLLYLLNLSETGGEDSTFDLSEDVLANIPMPENMLTSNINNFCANSVFNNCTINFCYEKK